MPFATPLSAGCRGTCIYGSSRAHYSTQVSDHFDSRQNKTHTFPKREQKYFSNHHNRPALMQQVCTAISNPCHVGQGLAGHPWCVNVANDNGKTKLYTPIRWKTTALPRCARHHSALRERPSPPRRGDESSGKRSHRYRSYSPERVRLLQPLLPHPQKRWRHATYSRSQTPELRPDEKVVQDDHFETDPPANMPRGLVHVAGSERHVLSHPGSPHHRRLLRFAFEGVAYQSKVLPFGLFLAPCTFTRRMDADLSSLRQMGIRILNYLNDWLTLAQAQAVLTSHKTLLLSPLDCLGIRVNFAKSILSPSQRVSFLGTVIDSVQMTATVSVERVTTIRRHVASFKEGTAPSAQSFPDSAGPYGSGFTGTSFGSASHVTLPSKKSVMRWQAADYITRRPSHFGGLWWAA